MTQHKDRTIACACLLCRTSPPRSTFFEDGRKAHENRNILRTNKCFGGRVAWRSERQWIVSCSSTSNKLAANSKQLFSSIRRKERKSDAREIPTIVNWKRSALCSSHEINLSLQLPQLAEKNDELRWTFRAYFASTFSEFYYFLFKSLCLFILEARCDRALFLRLDYGTPHKCVIKHTIDPIIRHTPVQQVFLR